MPQKKWLTTEDAADYLNVHPRTIDRWFRDGLLRRHVIGTTGSVRYASEDLDEVLTPEQQSHEDTHSSLSAEVQRVLAPFIQRTQSLVCPDCESPNGEQVKILMYTVCNRCYSRVMDSFLPNK